MATVFGASLSPMEREAQLIFMECDMTASKIEAIQDITNAQYERAIMTAEYTVLRDGGTYDDLDRLMMEAAAQQGEQKVGVIRTILNSIGSAISKIGNWIQRNLGGNQERLNQIPDGAAGQVNTYDMRVANEGLKGLPGLINKLKNALKTIKEWISGNTGAALATGAVTVAGIFTALFVRGSKEEQEAQEAPPEESNKETIIGYMRQYLKLQKEAEGAVQEANGILDRLGKPVQVIKDNAERIAAKKNAKREKKAAEKAAANGGDQQAAPAEGAKTESAETYGLSAYAGLFMESGEGIKCPSCGVMNPSGSKYCLSCGTKLPEPKPEAKPQQQQQQAKPEPPKDQKQQTGSTPPKTEKNPEPPKSEPQKDQASSGSTGSTATTSETKTQDAQQTQNAAPAGGTNTNNGEAQAEEKPASEFSKLPWYDKAITTLQSCLEVLLAGIVATGKCVLNLVSAAMKWAAHKTGLDTLEDKVMAGKTGDADKKKLKKAKKKIKQGVADAEAAQQEVQQQQAANAENGSEAAHDDTVTGDYTTESPDLFGIHEEYNEMMESPSMEELNSFEAIFDNL